MSSQTRPLHLLKLPTEIRDRIFNYVLLEHPEWSIMMCSTFEGRLIHMHYIDPKSKRLIPRSEARPQVQVLLICKQTHRKYRHVIWENRSFAWDCSSQFVKAFRFPHRVSVDAIDNLTSLELFICFTRNDPYLATWSQAWNKRKYEMDAFGRYTSTWNALRQVKLHLFGNDRGDPESRGFVYGIRSNRRGFMSPGGRLDLIDCHRGFVMILESLHIAVSNTAFPHRIRRANGRVEKLTQILDLGLKWNDYSDKYHKKNWATLTAILEACNAAFEGGEIWMDGILCWKNNVEQVCMKSIEDVRRCQRMMISA